MVPEELMAIPASVLASTAYWLTRFSYDYRGESPGKIHNGTLSEDGTPQWHPDFARWLTAGGPIDTPRPESRTPEDRLRTTRALRKLRSVAVREFEVVYRVMVLGDTVDDTTKWLNDRAQRNGIPLPPGQTVHYRRKDTVAIIVSGIEKMRDWW